MNLTAEMGKLPEPPSNSRPPYWDAWRHDLWTRAQQDDPRNFMRWPCVYHTMLTDHWPEQMKVEDAYVRRHIDMPMLNFDMVTASLPGTSYLSSLRNLTHQAYHLLRWQEATGLAISNMQSIYEFGGGYGAMALVARRMGFAGKYYIYDLPEFALLQQWYLGECGIDGVEWIGPEMGIVDLDLFIACYSLSETDYQERHLHLRCEQAKSYLFLYSNKFEDYNNTLFFQTTLPNYLHRQWWHERIEHLPPESWYTWGW